MRSDYPEEHQVHNREEKQVEQRVRGRSREEDIMQEAFLFKVQPQLVAWLLAMQMDSWVWFDMHCVFKVAGK